MSSSNTLPEISSEQAIENLLAGQPLLDVRAPVEYDKGSFPNSTNHPLLDNYEREQVGIRYKQHGNEAATELGHELIQGKRKSDLLAAWTTYLDDNPTASLYCFRGGQRSHISQQWLAQAGYQIPLIKGGYKALRATLHEQFLTQINQSQLVVIGGRTGVRKTTLIETLPTGVDLEKLANHRGSAFGRRPSPQPSTVDFEHALFIDVLKKAQNTPSGSLHFEDESRNIGSVAIPVKFREQLETAPIYLIEDSLDNRVIELCRAYVQEPLQQYEALHGMSSGRAKHADYLIDSLSRIQKRLGHERYEVVKRRLAEAISQTHGEFDGQDFTGHQHWIRDLLQQYYDPMYDYQISKKSANIVYRGSWEDVRLKAMMA